MLHELITQLSKDPTLTYHSRPLHCRPWAKRVLDLLDTNHPPTDLIAEAREVPSSGGESHTIIRITDNNTHYLWDGTGFDSHSPYFGPESEAPVHLQLHEPDNLINSYRLRPPTR